MSRREFRATTLLPRFRGHTLPLPAPPPPRHKGARRSLRTTVLAALLLLPTALLALSAPPVCRAQHDRPPDDDGGNDVAPAQLCPQIEQLALDARMPDLARSLLLRVGRDCPALVSGDVERPAALPLQRRLESFLWTHSATEDAADKQMEAFYDTVLGPDRKAVAAPVHAGAPGAERAGVAGDDAAAASRPRRAAGSAGAQPTRALRQVEGGSGRRELSTACGFQTSSSGNHSVPSDCDQSTTVSVSGSMRVEGAVGSGGSLPAIDRGGSGGRHFTVPAGATLTLRSVRLMDGAVSTSSCSSPYTNCAGGNVHVQGALVLEQTWLSGGRAYLGGAVFAIGSGASVEARGSTFSGNSVSARGGAMYLRNGATGSLFSCVVESNTGNGGGFYLHQVSLSLDGSTIHANTASGDTWWLSSSGKLRVETCISESGFCSRSSPVEYSNQRKYADFTLSDYPGASGCDVVCRAGLYSSPSLGPQGCPAGSFLADAGTDASLHDSVEDCSTCEAGTYAETTGAAICTGCPSGRFLTDPGTDPSLHDSQDDCSSCRAGEIPASITNGSCVACPAGAYAPRSGLAVCTACPAGLYNDDAGTAASRHVNCTACPAGSFLADAGTNASLHDSLKDCTTCAAGRYSAATNRTLPCEPCPAGTRLPDPATDVAFHDAREHCRTCPAGAYADEAGSSACRACPANTFITDDGQDEQKHDNDRDCISCLPGQFSSPGSQICGTCAAGKMTVTDASSNVTTCEDCPIGSFQPSGGNTTCALCPRGYFQDLPGKPYCLPCVPGTFGSRANASRCGACPRGYFSNETIQSSCIKCSAGRSTDVDASTRCVRTPPGTAGSQTCSRGHFCPGGASPMQPCAPGKYSDATGAARCLQCLPGFYSSRNGSQACDSCPAGYMAPGAARTRCDECDAGTHAGPNASACVTCRVRSSSPPGSTSEAACACQEDYWDVNNICEDCPDHAYCAAGCEAPVTVRGYWKVPWRGEGHEETRLACLSDKACLGPTKNDSGVNESCAPLHRGPLCAACSRGSYRVTGAYDCVACYDDEAASAVFVVLLVVGALVVIAAVAKLTLADGGQAAPVDVVVAKITMNHFVIASGAATFPLRWPPSVRALMSTMSLLSASAMGESAFSVDCVSRSGATRPVQAWALVTVVAPPALVLGAAALLLVVAPRLPRLRRDRQAPAPEERRGGSIAAAAAGPAFPVTVLVILILGHPTICKGAFNLLSCRTVGGRSFLESDMDVRCGSSEYLAWALGLGLPSLLAYGIGIPLSYFARMYHLHGAGRLQDERPVYGFLFSGYADARWWFELWNSIRKALFTGLTIVLTPLGPAMQAWGALLLLIGYIAAFAGASPYVQPWLNALERDALCTDALTLFLGLALFLNATNATDARSDELAMIATLVIVAINVWFVVRVVMALREQSAYAGALRQRLRRCRCRREPGEPQQNVENPFARELEMRQMAAAEEKAREKAPAPEQAAGAGGEAAFAGQNPMQKNIRTRVGV